MSEKKPECTYKKRKCAACLLAEALAPRPVFVTDAGWKVEEWRAEGRKRMESLRYRNSQIRSHA